MKTIRVIGILLLFLSGYLTHIVVAAPWDLLTKLTPGIFIVFLIHIGIGAVIAKDGKSFRQSIADAFSWPIHLLP
jgi:hypothetical protein